MTLQETLCSFNLTRNYRGYHQLCSAVRLVQENPRRLDNVMTDVYQVVADEFECSVACVERNIRTIILKAWKTKHERLREVAGYMLITPPTVAAFIDMLALYSDNDY